jgi:predicted permease
MGSFFRKLNYWRRRRQKDAELQEELQFHLDEETEERQIRGLSHEQAQREARRSLGNVALLQEDTRAAWSWIFLEQFLQDLRYAVRSMLANKTFMALAMLSLALGIGANTAIFSFMDAILLRSLPVPHPESLVTLSWHTQRPQTRGMNRHDDSFVDPSGGGFTGGFFAYPAFELLQKNEALFSSVFGYQGAGTLNLRVNGQADTANGDYVSGEYFSGLGIAPAAGRLIAAEDDRAGAPAVAVLSYSWSARHFVRAEEAAGQSILINNIPFTIAGVAPPEFFGADPQRPPDVYLPLHSNLLIESANRNLPPAPLYIDPDFDWIDIMARLRNGVTAAQAQAVLASEYAGWQRSVAGKRNRSQIASLILRDGRSGLDSLRRSYSKPLYILWGLVALILAIACANIANLSLARAAARKREMAVRLSIGAGRFRVIRQLLTENVLLAGVSGVAGLAFAFWGIRFLTLLLSNGREDFTLHAVLNWQVLAASFVLSVLCGVLFGLAPAIQSTRVDVAVSLKDLRTGERVRRLVFGLSLSRILIVAQIALAIVILLGTGLFVRTLAKLESIQLGFNRENVLTFQLNARQAGHSDPEIVMFYRDLQEQFRTIPGVRDVSLSLVPLIGQGTMGMPVRVMEKEPKGSRILPVGSGFFSTMQIPILRGRAIDDHDQPASRQVAVVNGTFARTIAAADNPIGMHLTIASPGSLSVPAICAACDIEIVGLAADARYGALKGDFPPVVYLPYNQSVTGQIDAMWYEIRTAGNPLNVVREVRNIVHSADGRVPLAEVTTQSALIDGTINQQIAFARLCTAFAGLALIIACVGLYATMSYNVTRRTGEIGIRMALGAERRRVVWMVFREVCILFSSGLVISVPACFSVVKLIQSFLFGVQPGDPRAIAAAVVTLAAAAILAGYLPARHAARIDPAVALRHE